MQQQQKDHQATSRGQRWYVFVIAALIGVVALGLWTIFQTDSKTPSPAPLVIEAPPEPWDQLGFAEPVLSSKGTVNALVVFAQFSDEANKGTEIPQYAKDLFKPDLEGSLTHFYSTMSYGQLQIQGTVLPKRYTADGTAASYLAPDALTRGDYHRFVKDILKKVDAEVDLGRFDNNGPDGVPNSGDDDRKVDYVFVIPRTVPPNFIRDRASGQAGLGFLRLKSRQDRAPDGKQIYFQGSRYDGALIDEGTWTTTVGIMAHEMAHSLGLPDLYDASFQNEPDQDLSADGAGIGRWGLMGRGTLGWNGDDGPNPLCAWSREQLGWIGRDNDRLLLVERDSSDFRLADLPVVDWEEFALSRRQLKLVHTLLGQKQPAPTAQPLAPLRLPAMGEGALGFARNANSATQGDFAAGFAYKIFLPSSDPDAIGINRPYLLIERQTRQAHYYNRNLPGEGVLIWHISPLAGDNDDESHKLVDLICADGIAADGTYHLGAPDDMDRWARDPAYAQAQGGSLGDAGDLFDGGQYKRLVLALENQDQPLVVAMRREGSEIFSSIRLPWTAAPPPEAIPTAVVEAVVNSLDYHLQANFPNPFNPSTTIPYQLAAPTQVRLVVYNTLGQVVRVLVDQHQPPGSHQAVWDGRDSSDREAASGTYLFRLEAGTAFSQTRQMALIR